MTTEETLAHWYRIDFEPLRLRSKRPNTKRLYVNTIGNFRKFLKREPTLADLNDDTVSRFLSWFRDLGRSPATANKELANLLTMWRFACRRKLLDRWPMVEKEIVPEREPIAWTEDEMHVLFATARRHQESIGVIPGPVFWSALLLMLWDTGERVGGLLGLTWEQVDLKRGFVRVAAEDRKGGRKDRLFKLSDQSILALKELRACNRRDRVFALPFSRQTIYDRYEKLLRKAGLPYDRRSKFHRVRKTVATFYELAGGNATELLGHSARKITLAYIDRRICQIPQACDKLFRLGGATG